jgi:hypothetical protein
MEALERGAVTAFVQPKVDVESVHDAADVQRLYLVLTPEGGTPRRLAIARKRLPVKGELARVPAIVDAVGDVERNLSTHAYATRSHGARIQYGAREVATGHYTLRAHEDHVHLDLELSAVDKQLATLSHLHEHATYVLLYHGDEGFSHLHDATQLARDAHVVLVAA